MVRKLIENFNEKKKYVENLEKLTDEYKRRKERLKKANDYLKRYQGPVGESAGESKESAGESKESAAAAPAPTSASVSASTSTSREYLIRYAKEHRVLFNKFVEAMTSDRRTLIDRFYFTDERLERRGNPFGNDPKNYTDFILRIFEEFSKTYGDFQDSDDIFFNFSIKFNNLAGKLFGEKTLIDYSIVKASGLL